jgi:hypothetical protein
MSSQPDRVRGQDYLADLDSLTAVLKRTQLQCGDQGKASAAFSVGSVFVPVCSTNIRWQVFITPMRDGLRSSMIKRFLKVLLLWLPLQLLPSS